MGKDAAEISADRSAALGQRARERGRRGHFFHRHRRLGGGARHGIRPGAWRPAIRDGARHFFRWPAHRGSARADRIPHGRRLDGTESARCDAAPAPALAKPWRKADRRYHRDYALLPFPCDPRFPARRARAPSEKRGQPAGVYGVRGQERGGSFLDRKRPFHGGLGSRGGASADAALRRHRAVRRGSQAGGVGDQGSRHQAGGRTKPQRGRAAAGR